MTRRTCGARMLWGVVTRRFASKPDAPHRANFRGACGTNRMRLNRFVLLFIVLAFMTSCSSRIEYERPIAQAPATAININTATVDDLERLPHIGRKTAEAIVEFRTANGPFRRVEHLMLIRGVSETRFAELSPILRAD